MAEFNVNQIKIFLNKNPYLSIIIFVFPIFVTLILFFFQNEDDYVALSNTNYKLTNQFDCQPDSRPGASGASYGESTREGVKFNVRTPLNYDSRRFHPLLMVYAPAGSNRAKTEKNTQLTIAATKNGYIVAYADHPELSPTSTIDLGTIPSLIAKKWCVDEKKVFLTGHSDGGTVSMALAFMSGTKHIPTAIAASAAGVNHSSLAGHNCPAPIPVMIMHSKNDHLFPGYGLESTGWWADCNNCDPIPEQLANGCKVYRGCDDNVETWYCEGTERHSKWPAKNQAIIDFFNSVLDKQ